MSKVFDFISTQQVINVAGISSALYVLAQLYKINVSEEEIKVVIGAGASIILFIANMIQRARQGDLKYGFIRK